jgi:hypothetical protein
MSLDSKFPWTSTSCVFFSLSSYGDLMKRLSGNMFIASAIPCCPPKVALKAITLLKHFRISVGATSLLLTILKASLKKRWTSSTKMVELAGIK